MKRFWMAGLLVLGTMGSAEAQTLYRYVDAQGQVHITDGATGRPAGASVVAAPAPRSKASIRDQFEEICRGLDQLNAPRSRRMDLICEDLARESAREMLKGMRTAERAAKVAGK